MNRVPNTSPTDQNLSEYAQYGFTVIRKVFDSDWTESLLTEINNLRASPSIFSILHQDEGDDGGLFIDRLMHRRSKLFSKLALDSPALLIAASFLRTPNFFFFYDQLFVKEANTITRTQWHQDLPFWPLGGTAIPSIWIALTETDELRSAVQYIPGSHRDNLLYEPIHASEREKALRAGKLVCPDFHMKNREEVKIVANDLAPGDVVIHHPLVVHGAGPNLSSSMRLAISLRYCSPLTTWNPRPNTMHFPGTLDLVSGTPFSAQHVFPECHLASEYSLNMGVGA